MLDVPFYCVCECDKSEVPWFAEKTDTPITSRKRYQTGTREHWRYAHRMPSGNLAVCFSSSLSIPVAAS